MGNEISIRVLGNEDATALQRLAGRDSSEVPRGALLGATVNGRLVAALSLAGDGVISDPFVQTEQVRELLAERAAQLNGGRRGGLLGRLPGRASRRSRGALPASPPGAGGKLLQI